MHGFVCAALLCNLAESAPLMLAASLQSTISGHDFSRGLIVLGACWVGAQTPPLRDESVADKTLAPLSAANPVVRDGLFSIDVVVTDATGNPVSDLAPWDFTLLDNGQPARIRTFHHAMAKSEPASELIFVLDTVNLSPQQLTQTEGAISRFLGKNSGHLKSPCFLYRLTRDGLFSSLRPVTDGALLVNELEQKRSQSAVWRSGRDEGPNLLRAWVNISQPNELSLRALGSIAIDQRDVPGHKIVVWIGPGWPVNGGEIGFDEATELSTRLREARITLDNINVWPNPNQALNYHNYLEAPRSQKDMQPAKLGLQVIATHTGGLVLDSSGEPDPDLNLKLDRDIARCVAEMRSFYTLTFNPPHTYTMDEYHNLRVELRAGVDRPALTVRVPTGYYNEPVYFDNPRPGIQKASVAQLEDFVHAQIDVPRRLANLELTERLSTPRLDALLSIVHGERERQALTADADLSFGLAPPPDEILNQPPPPVEEQRAILGRTLAYLQNAIPKLPDFSALRDTVRYEEPIGRPEENWKMPHLDQTLHFVTGEHATVLYRNGQEVVEKKQKLGKGRAVRGVRSRGLETTGTFGPILAIVLTAAATSPSTLSWKRWERSKYGDLAVFSYKVSGTNSGPELTFCCLPEGDGTTPYQSKADSYGGEFALNPDSGAIMRIVINADLNEERDPDVPLIRSQIMLEYGPVELGGKTYICPQRSVEISRGRSERELHEWGKVFSVYSYFETMINDVTFGGYHKFGSEARILPGFEEAEDTKTPAPPKKNEDLADKQQPAIEESNAPRLVTVAELMKLVDGAKRRHDGDAAKEIEQLQLTERLSSTKLAMLSSVLPGKKSKSALTALGDASVFLDPPRDESSQSAAPDIVNQKQMMSLVTEYLKKTIPKLPNFYAQRFTTSFEETRSPSNKKGGLEEGAMHSVGNYRATVYYRDGQEIVDQEGAHKHGLTTRGIFGPILSVVILDAARSNTMQWSRWEEGPSGSMAVFRFQVPQTDLITRFLEARNLGDRSNRVSRGGRN